MACVPIWQLLPSVCIYIRERYRTNKYPNLRWTAPDQNGGLLQISECRLSAEQKGKNPIKHTMISIAETLEFVKLTISHRHEHEHKHCVYYLVEELIEKLKELPIGIVGSCHGRSSPLKSHGLRSNNGSFSHFSKFKNSLFDAIAASSIAKENGVKSNTIVEACR